MPDDKPSDEVWLVFNGFVLVNYTTREEAMQYVRDAIDRCEAVGSLTVYKATPVEIKITLGE